MKIHMVKKGDTLFLISQKYNVPLEEVIKANPEIANPDAIDVGMKVKIPPAPKPTYELMHQHTVLQGDTLWKLSKAWGIPLAHMIQANPQLKNPNVLLTGEVVNIPKLEPGGATGQPVYPGGSGGDAWQPGVPQWIPGKKDTGVKPETGMAIEPAPTPPPAPLPELPAMPAPVLPAPEFKHPYPLTYHHEHELFLQFPVPAAEAGAYAPYPETSPVPVKDAPYPETPFVHDYSPYFGHAHALGYGHDHAVGYSHDHAHGYGYAHDYVPAYDQHHDHGHGYVGLEGAIGSVYDPKDISGYAPKTAGFGDISQTGPTHGGHGVAGYLPAYVPGLVSPAGVTAKPASGCKTCGGTPSWQAPATAWPTAAAPLPAMPAMPAYPTMPMPGAPTAPPFMPGAPTAVSPSAIGPYPGELPQAYPAAGGYPYTTPYVHDAYPAAAAPYGYDTYAQAVTPYPDDTYAHAFAPYPHGAYAPTVAPYPDDTYAHAVAPYPHDAYGVGTVPYGYDVYAHGAPYEYYTHTAAPYAVYPAAGYDVTAPGYAPYCPPYHADWAGIPPIPPIPPMPPFRDEDQPEEDDSSLSLHALDNMPPSSPAARRNKGVVRSKPKASSRRRTKSGSKQSLPWIKW